MIEGESERTTFEGLLLLGGDPEADFGRVFFCGAVVFGEIGSAVILDIYSGLCDIV